MSDNDISRIMEAMWQLKERTETTNKNIEKLIFAIEDIKKNGCIKGTEYEKALQELTVSVANIKTVWRKALLIMAGVGVGSVGAEKTLGKILEFLNSLNL